MELIMGGLRGFIGGEEFTFRVKLILELMITEGNKQKRQKHF